MKPLILIVDDDKDFIMDLSLLLERDFSVIYALNEKEGIRLLNEKSPDLVLLDLMFNENRNGLQILEKMLTIDSSLPVIMMTDYASVETAIKAIQLGAVDYISKTPKMLELKLIIQRALKNRLDLLRKEELEKELYLKYAEIVGESQAIKNTKEKIKLYAGNSNTVLITGESGVGKELVARQIHYHSSRKDKPFIAVNCAALPNDLIESELFGYEKGAFTGALKRKPGKFEIAEDGTIFLDEISELTSAAQVKLLRILQEKEFERVGGTKTIAVKCRVLSATNKNLKMLVDEGKFREDLFYRLDVLRINVPPLRERKSDIPLLAEHFVRRESINLNVPEKQISEIELQKMIEYDWPGNIRELKNHIIRMLIVPESENLTLSNHPSNDNFSPIDKIPENWDEMDMMRREAADKASREIETLFLENLLNRFDGNVTKAAEHIGINRSNLHKMIKKCGIRD
jgi:DNA-binding NtrC family response regulator